ncbi:protein-tyrosine-phosphatase [Spirochaetia bacterium]|nr:protein-tyrosine-phosphatase [Spirochaetia bacterium]
MTDFEADPFSNPRLLSMESLFNVRDLGGYAVGSGPVAERPVAERRQVKWGLLFRAGDLHKPSERDRALLEKKGIRTIVDFRGADEVERAPDCEIGTVKKTYHLPIEAGNMVDLSRTERASSGETLMEGLYRVLVDEARPQYREFFKILSEKGSAAPQAANTPLLFHCSAGKDRTGLAAALILSALGLDREQVFQDYSLSGIYLKDKYRTWLEKEPYLEPVMSIRRSYLDAAFSRIEADFGGMEQYLGTELGVDTALLRELYTEAF